MSLRFFFLFYYLILLSPLLCGGSLSEMKDSFIHNSEQSVQSEAYALNDEMGHIRNQLRDLSEKSQHLLNEGSSHEHAFTDFLAVSKNLKQQLKEKELEFRKIMSDGPDEEPYALMHEKETSLERLITDYASSSYLYIIPSEMARIELHLCSSLAIPKASWEEVIEVICLQNGIGIKKINSFVKSLYWTLGNHSSSLKHIISQSADLELISPHEQVCFILPLNGSEVQNVHQFLKRFVNERVTSLHTIGTSMLIVGEASEVKELTKLVEFIKVHQQDRAYKLVQIDKISLEDVQSILAACFQNQKSDVNSKGAQDTSAIIVVPIKQHLLLMGSEKDLEKATKILEDISNQICSPDQMALHWYTCRYSDPQDLALLLQQVYQVMSCQEGFEEEPHLALEKSTSSAPCNLREGTIPPTCVIPNLVVNPKAAPAPSDTPVNDSFPNFIVDAKTGLIIMAVKQAYLEKLKDLVKKLDIPKKMVEIEVLLFEKKIVDQTQFGLNLLKLGDNVKKNDAQMKWNVSTADRSAPGILNYFFARKNPGKFAPPFSFAYNFLISQEDICVHSNPTITTVNQTQAIIDLVEEQSINMGTVEDPRTSTISNTFVRAQYGIIIQITPTINYGDEDNNFTHYVTLETDIIFDTTTSDKNNRPDVSRRHIQNQVRIANGETLILGGLRRKNSETNVDKIPFIGDIPGVGRLFSFTTLEDKSTEMFILITPRIVEDSVYETQQYKIIDLRKRPGDSSELFKKILEAKGFEKEQQYKSTFQKLFNHGKDTY
ncbi:MAG: Type 3 secretion system secretin [Chlamydiae bacterium]|nr:Type 3 secretion system secretin [Chlamydiota bacterium]